MGWDRKILKSRAKDVLRRSYWLTFAVLLVVTLMSTISNWTNNVLKTGNLYRGLGNYFIIIDNFIGRLIRTYGVNKDDILSQPEINYLANPKILSFGLIALVIYILLWLFVINPLTVGKARYMFYNSKSNTKFNVLWSGFLHNYIKTVGTMALTGLIIAIGFIFFIIPGIILGYALRMVPYIIAENPNISATRAISISFSLTNNNKWNIFVLDLSFLGWYLLCIPTIGIGNYFLAPYVESTNAELYGALRYNGAQQKLFTPDELASELFV